MEQRLKNLEDLSELITKEIVQQNKSMIEMNKNLLSEIKAMRDAGYDADFSVGITAASSTIGPIIPPSLPLVIYGVMASTSIGQLFAAGLIPGLLMAVSLMVIAWRIPTAGRTRSATFPSVSRTGTCGGITRHMAWAISNTCSCAKTSAPNHCRSCRWASVVASDNRSRWYQWKICRRGSTMPWT